MSDPDPVAAAWLSEMWQSCRELPYGERLEKRESDRLARRDIEDLQAAHSLPPTVPSPAELSTGCAETGGLRTDRGAA